MSNVNVVLAHKLDILDKYLRLEANELIFTKSCEFFVDYGDRWERIVDEKLDYEFLTSFLQQLATRRHQRFNEKYPSLSCELPPPYLRYRVQAQHESILFNSDVSICIRIPSNKRFELESFKLSDKLIQQGWNYDLIRQFIRDKKNVLVSGGTGSGKTSFLNSLMGEIPKEDRVVTIEDSQELFIENENRTQIAIPKEEGIYTYTTAINNAMRLRPDRLFLGEIDIRNTLAFLRVNNSGHEGNLSTLHANSTEDSINAIITNSMFSGMNTSREAMLDYIRSAIDFIIQIARVKRERIIVDILNVKEYLKPSLQSSMQSNTQTYQSNANDKELYMIAKAEPRIKDTHEWVKNY